MKKLLFLLCSAAPGFAAVITFNPITYSDNNGGIFLSGASSSVSGNVLDVLIPNFSQSNFAFPSPGEVDLAFTVVSSAPILSISYSFSGSFSNLGLGSYVQTVGTQTDSNTFNTVTAGHTLLPVGNPLSVDLTTVLQLADNGDSASIGEARFTVNTGAAVPEPSTWFLFGCGLCALCTVRWHRRGSTAALGIVALVALSSVPADAQQAKPGTTEDPYAEMSPMGRLAMQVSNRLRTVPNGAKGHTVRTLNAPPKPNECANEDEDCSADGFSDGPSGGQAELSIAVDASGQHIVVGFNDTRGFSRLPISVSGYAYSDNGGVSFTDGGQLPNVSNGAIGTTQYPQVFGDSDVRFVPGGAGCQFVYASIFVKGIGGSGTAFTGNAQTLSLHRSIDCGHSWTGPFEITGATNPHGLMTGSNAQDAADKELIDLDPETKRLLVSWSNFTATTIEIRTTYSDNIMTATPPTWTSGVIVASGNVTGSVPRFVGNGSSNAYVAYSNGGVNVGFARSLDNGATWGTPINLAAVNYVSPDQIVGSDRIHSFPTMAVDNSGGTSGGNIYVAAATQNSFREGGSDVTLWRSTNAGVTFSAGTLLDPNPGADRAQWFPNLSADTSTGRVNLMYDDQHIASSGDLMEMTRTYSDDGGVTWAPPTPITKRPFRANYGNDSGQPNIGDYNASQSQNGLFYAAFAATPNQALFTDVQPLGSFPYPSFLATPNPLGFAVVSGGKAALSLGTPSLTDSGGNGFVDAGDQVRYRLPLTNYNVNSVTGALSYSNVSGTLSTSTAGVSILAATRPYANLAPGTTGTNTADFVLQIAPGFVPGTPIEFVLTVTAAQGSTTLPFTQQTGTPVNTVVFSENFNSTAPGALPAGWGTIHQGGANTVSWTTRAGFCSGSTNALYHQELEDGPTTTNDATRFERATSPNIVIPAGAAYSTLDFDICYNLEDDAQYGGYSVLGYDGAHLRITDFTSGRLAAAVWAEAFAADFFTGAIQSYPKHLPRANTTAYFQDIPAWSGNSGGFQHVSMRLPGTAGSTVQLRPDYTQDSNGICVAGGAACGVAIDNIVLRSVTLKSDELGVLTLRPVSGQPGVYTGIVTSQAIAPAGGIVVALSSSAPAQTTIPASVTIPAGAQTSPSFTVTLTARGTLVTVTATGPSNSRSAGISVSN